MRQIGLHLLGYLHRVAAIELPDDQFDNFVSRVKNHGRGEPLFGNGAGTVSWIDMQIDLDKAALDKITVYSE